MKRTNLLRYVVFGIALLTGAVACGSDSPGEAPPVFRLESIRIGNEQDGPVFSGVRPGDPVVLTFSDRVAVATVRENIRLTAGEQPVDYTCTPDGEVLRIEAALKSFASYKLVIHPGLRSEAGVPLETGKVYTLQTGMDDSDKFERIPDEELLTLVQRRTFDYFWKFGHPHSGMARERSTSGNTVTTGGSGFGILATVVAAERGFVTRQEACARLNRITAFLETECTRYHGAFAHWINGETGATVPFSAKDDGADLVETAFLFQGLLTARAYFTGASADETALREAITRLWEAVEWDWFRKDGEPVLYWHWSPTCGWEMNHRISGWNECLITYVLAAASPTHAVGKDVYDAGWARNGAFRNGKTFYGHTLPLGSDLGGPLFFTHYSFLGLDPNGLVDAYADYGEQNRNHARIHYGYCVENPKGYGGYGPGCWGLTACDGNEGYSAFSPTNDKGVIAPTAALASFPYTPEQSMEALHFYYYKLGDKLWKEYGFVDAFNLSASWYDDQYLAIDQGPIVCMIENYRTGLLWKLFMSVPEVKAGLQKLGFSSRYD